MKKLSIALVLFLLPVPSMASEAGIHLLDANADLSDRRSLQRGAKLFVNYCLSCHSAKFMRYNRMGRDLGLTDQQVEKNLMFGSEKVGDVMTVAMRDEARPGRSSQSWASSRAMIKPWSPSKPETPS